jgi:tRNA1(Val) A37 N6-methylase TrmN6
MTETVDTLPGCGLSIVQREDAFKYGIDAVLLAHFPRVLPGRNGHVVDLCAGNGAVGLMLSARTDAHIVEIEIQPTLSNLTERSIALNGLSEHIESLTMDLSDAPGQLGTNGCDLVICNPPYFKHLAGSRLNEQGALTLARHEVATDFATICRTAQQLLKGQGHFVLIHRPDRFFELTETLRAHRLQPKRIQFVYPKAKSPANLLLIDTIKDAQAGGEIFEPPLIVHEADGSYTPELLKIYNS